MSASVIKAIAVDYGDTISASAIDHLLGQKPVDPAAAAVLRILHDDWHLRLVLASNTLPCESRWPALQKAGIDALFRAALLSYPLGIRILRTNWWLMCLAGSVQFGRRVLNRIGIQHSAPAAYDRRVKPGSRRSG